MSKVWRIFKNEKFDASILNCFEFLCFFNQNVSMLLT